MQRRKAILERLDRPIRPWGSAILVIGALLLALSFTVPLWRIGLRAPQYPQGLHLEIYSHKIDGGDNGQHIQEINTLNHYIGMQRIDREHLKDLDWLPFAFGILVLLALRSAAIGTTRSAVDLAVLTTYVSGFALARFYYRLYSYGHDLAPDAPMKIEPFTPVMFGTKQVANFTTSSYPQLGSLFVLLFVAGTFVVAAGHLMERREAKRRQAVPVGPTRTGTPVMP